MDRELRESWSAAFPELTFHVAEWGYADAQAFQVPYGVREWLAEGDSLAAIVGELAALVDRQTAELALVSYVGELDRMSTMERVGIGHPRD